MSYEVFARKTRPRNFSQVVGQEHVLQALANGLDQDRVHHAFLFTGTRGVGKTTIARIFAKALNCAEGVSSNPCGKCDNCVDIDSGRFVDLMEIDAASRTGVDDIRELIDNVQYTPTVGKYKVYLIDEVHMLSKNAFNALLKTLEEPPPHVKFLLATTDPQKLPITVLSRCLQFHLKRLETKQIADHLQSVLQADGIEFEADALMMLSRAADGSLRDSLSLLDQAVAFGGGSLKNDATRDMLGVVERNHIIDLCRAVAASDAEAVFAVINELYTQSIDFAEALAEFATVLQRMAVYQRVPKAVQADEPAFEAIVELAGQISPTDIQMYYQIALAAQRDLPLAPDARSGFEMALLRILAFQPAALSEAPVPVKKSDNSESVSVAEPLKNAEPEQPIATDVSNSAIPIPPPTPVENKPALSEDVEWSALIHSLPLDGMAKELAMHCVVTERNEQYWELKLDGDKQLLDRLISAKSSLLSVLAEHLNGIKINLDVAVDPAEVAVETPAQSVERRKQQRLADAEASIERDPNILALKNLLGAEVIQGSVKVIEQSASEA